MSFWKINNLVNNEKELVLYGDIVDAKPWWGSEDNLYITPGSFLNDIEKLKNETSITIRIDSGGGDVFTALAIFNQLKQLKATKTVIIDGLCASAATIIAMAGDVVKIPKSSLFMVHDPKVVAYDNFGVEELEKIKNLLEKSKASIIEVYKTKSSLTDEELAQLMSDETWMLGNEAVEYGFADEVIDYNVQIQNNGKFLVVNSVNRANVGGFKNLPENIERVSNSTPTGVEDKLKNQNKQEGAEEKVKDLQELKEKYPDIYNQAVNEGAKTERQRFKEIDAIANMVDPTLLNKARYEEPIDAPALAFENMKLENKVIKTFNKNKDSDYEDSNVENVGVTAGFPTNNENENEKDARIENARRRINDRR